MSAWTKEILRDSRCRIIGLKHKMKRGPQPQTLIYEPSMFCLDDKGNRVAVRLRDSNNFKPRPEQSHLGKRNGMPLINGGNEFCELHGVLGVYPLHAGIGKFYEYSVPMLALERANVPLGAFRYLPAYGNDLDAAVWAMDEISDLYGIGSWIAGGFADGGWAEYRFHTEFPDRLNGLFLVQSPFFPDAPLPKRTIPTVAIYGDRHPWSPYNEYGDKPGVNPIPKYQVWAALLQGKRAWTNRPAQLIETMAAVGGLNEQRPSFFNLNDPDAIPSGYREPGPGAEPVDHILFQTRSFGTNPMLPVKEIRVFGQPNGRGGGNVWEGRKTGPGTETDVSGPNGTPLDPSVLSTNSIIATELKLDQLVPE